MAPDQLAANAERLRGIPGIIVQGQYDLLCPPHTAHALAAKWPDAEVRTIAHAGHSLYDPGICDAVMTAIAELGERKS
jgi:proline iminopeptidase